VIANFPSEHRGLFAAVPHARSSPNSCGGDQDFDYGEFDFDYGIAGLTGSSPFSEVEITVPITF